MRLLLWQNTYIKKLSRGKDCAILKLKLTEKTTKLKGIYQRNFCKKPLKTTKKLSFDTLDKKKIMYSRIFWKTILPHFTQKVSKVEKINLIENNDILSDEEICSTFNDFFANAVINLNIPVIKHSH